MVRMERCLRREMPPVPAPAESFEARSENSMSAMKTGFVGWFRTSKTQADGDICPFSWS